MSQPLARLFTVVLTGSLTFACFDPFEREVRQFFDCASAGTAPIRQGDPQEIFECEVPDPWILVALPGRKVEASELSTLGVSPELASMLAASDEPRARLCLAREIPHEETTKPGKYETARSSCTMTETTIREPLYSPSGTVRISLRRSDTGQPILEHVERQN